MKRIFYILLFSLAGTCSIAQTIINISCCSSDTIEIPADTVFVPSVCDTVFVPDLDTVFVPDTDTVFVPVGDTVFIPDSDTVFTGECADTLVQRGYYVHYDLTGLRYNTTNSYGVTMNNAPSQFSDLSGNGLHFTQSNASNKGMLDTASNGLMTVNFDGNDYYNNTDKPAFKFLHSGESTVYIFGAYGSNANPNSQDMLMGNAASTSVNTGINISYDNRTGIATHAVRAHAYKGDSQGSINNTGVFNRALFALVPSLTVVRANYNSADVCMDIVTVNTDLISGGNSTRRTTPSVNNATYDLQIGAGGNNVSPMYGNMQEIVIYNVRHTTEEIEQNTRYFQNKFLSKPFYDWMLVNASANFRAQDGHKIGVFNGTKYLIGGWNPNLSPVLSNKVFESVDWYNWSEADTFPGKPRHSAGIVQTDTSFILFGGDRTGDILEFDGSWHVRATNVAELLNRRAFLYGTALNKIYWLGGYRDSCGVAVQTVTTVCSWSPSTDVVIEDTIPFAFAATTYGMPFYKGEFWIARGARLNNACTVTYDYSDEMWSWNPVTKVFTLRGTHPDLRRAYMNVIEVNGELLCATGYYNGNNTFTAMLTEDGAIYRPIIYAPYSARHAAICYNDNGTVYMLGGSAPNPSNDVWKMVNKKGIE